MILNNNMVTALIGLALATQSVSGRELGVPPGSKAAETVVVLAFDAGLRTAAQNFGAAIDRLQSSQSEQAIRALGLACREFRTQYERCHNFLGREALNEIVAPSEVLLTLAQKSLRNLTANPDFRAQSVLAERELRACQHAVRPDASLKR